MKKIIYSSLLAVIIGVGGIIFITNKFTYSEPVIKRDYILGKSFGKNSIYPFKLAFPRGTKAIDIAKLFFQNPEEIYIKNKKVWHKIDFNTSIYQDVVMKT